MGNAARKLTPSTDKEAGRPIGKMAKPVLTLVGTAVETVKKGQDKTAEQVKSLEKERIQARLETVKVRLDQVRKLAISEGCEDPGAKKSK